MIPVCTVRRLQASEFVLQFNTKQDFKSWFSSTCTNLRFPLRARLRANDIQLNSFSSKFQLLRIPYFLLSLFSHINILCFLMRQTSWNCWHVPEGSTGWFFNALIIVNSASFLMCICADLQVLNRSTKILHRFFK